jgi:hypothetical protein
MAAQNNAKQSGEAIGQDATLGINGDADETTPLIPPVADIRAERGEVDGNLEPPKTTVAASVSRSGGARAHTNVKAASTPPHSFPRPLHSHGSSRSPQNQRRLSFDLCAI